MYWKSQWISLKKKPLLKPLSVLKSYINSLIKILGITSENIKVCNKIHLPLVVTFNDDELILGLYWMEILKISLQIITISEKFDVKSILEQFKKVFKQKTEGKGIDSQNKIEIKGEINNVTRSAAYSTKGNSNYGRF